MKAPERFQNSLPPSTAGDASFFRSGSGEGLSEPVMEFPALLGVFLISKTGTNWNSIEFGTPFGVSLLVPWRKCAHEPWVRGRGCRWYGTSVKAESHFTCFSARCAPQEVPDTFHLHSFWAFLGAWEGEGGTPENPKATSQEACLRKADPCSAWLPLQSLAVKKCTFCVNFRR